MLYYIFIIVTLFFYLKFKQTRIIWEAFVTEPRLRLFLRWIPRKRNLCDHIFSPPCRKTQMKLYSHGSYALTDLQRRGTGEMMKDDTKLGVELKLVTYRWHVWRVTKNEFSSAETGICQWSKPHNTSLSLTLLYFLTKYLPHCLVQVSFHFILYLFPHKSIFICVTLQKLAKVITAY